MIPTLPTLHAERVTADEERRLVTAAQDGSPEAREHALDRLTRAYMPAIRKAARVATASRRVQPLEPDDALATAAVAFVQCVSDFDTSLPVRLANFAPTIMVYEVLAAQRATSAVSIAPRTAAKFFALMRSHDSDPLAVLADTDALSEIGMRRETFLAVLEAFKPAASTDAETDDDDATRAGAVGLAAQFASPDPADAIVQREYVSWLFSKVEDRTALVLRLYYGFTDDETEQAREDGGFRLGELLTDDQVGTIIGRSRTRTQYVRTAGLATMRRAADLAAADETR